MAAYFVTGAGTDVGKTYVTAGLVAAARAAGRHAAAVKPVMSGYDEAAPALSDAGALLAAMGRDVTAAAVAEIAPWRFVPPISPDMAAARSKRRLAADEMAAFARKAAAGAELLLCEGAGGAMVPINERETMLDWMVALRWPVLLVGGSYLGSISHTLTAARCVVAAGLQLAAVVLSESETSPVPVAETATVVRRFCAAPVHVLPRAEAAGFTNLAAALA